MRQIEGTEYVIETPRQCSCRPLDVQTEARIAHLMRRRKCQFVTG